MSEVKIQPNNELVKAQYLVSVGNYQKLLQEMEDIQFSKDTLDQDYAPLKKAREILKKIEDVRVTRKAPHLEACKREDEVAKSISGPLVEILERKTREYAAFAKELKADQEREKAEADRKKRINETISTFILSYSQKAAEAQTNEELIAIEKLINLESTRKDRYEEYLPTLKAATEPIRKLLADQKERVKELVKTSKQVSKEAENANDAKAIELMEKQEQLQGDIDLHKTLIQEAAIQTAQSLPVEEAEVVLPGVPKARRTTWEVEIVDFQTALKEAQPLLNITLNTVTAKAFFKAKVGMGEIPKGKEVTLMGIRYYEKSIY